MRESATQDDAITPWLGAVHTKDFPGAHLGFCRFAHEAGFRWVELKYEPWLDERSGLMTAATEVRRYAHDRGLTLSVHAAYDAGVNIAALDEDRRRRSLDAYQESLDYAARVGARYLTLHGGDLPSDAGSGGHDLLVERTIDALTFVARSASHVGVVVSVENRHRFGDEKRRYPVYPEELRACLDALPGDVKCTIDSGHANSVPGATLVEFVRAVGPERVALTHLHDNLGDADHHLLPGEGSVAFEPFLAAWREEAWRFPLSFELPLPEQFGVARERVVRWLRARA